MYQINSLNDQSSILQKLKNFDYILVLCILLLGLISALSMYSTDGGVILYHTKSHIFKFLIFFPMMVFLSFLNIKFWHFFWLYILFYCFIIFNLGIPAWH